MKSYYADLKICHTLQSCKIDWQNSGMGIAMGCSISPILFTATLEVILRSMIRGVHNSAGQWLPPLSCFMDDVTSLLQTTACTSWLLRRFEELTEIMGQDENKTHQVDPHSVSIHKGRQIGSVSFQVAGEKIPLLTEQPIRSLSIDQLNDA